MEVQRVQKAILHATKENKESDIIKKADQKSNHTVQRNTKADSSRVANTVASYMNLTTVCHLKKAAQYVGMQTTSEMLSKP